jgi:hypothetical protein
VSTETRKPLRHWQGQGSDQRLEDWTGLEAIYQELTSGEFAQYTSELTEDEILRLSLFAWNGSWSLVPEDLPLLIAQEQEAFYGEYDDEAEFAEAFFTDTGLLDEEATKNLVIDWQGTYRYSLQYDYHNYHVYDHEGLPRQFFWNSNA